MGRGQRMRALANAGKQPRIFAGGADGSRSQKDAANSENSVLGEGDGGAARLETSPYVSEEGLAGYLWYQEYVTLTERFPWRLAAYIAWAASPVKGRAPATQQELARALGLKTDRTIRQWKEKDPTIDQEIEKLQAAPLWRHRRDLYDALVKAATDGDVPALKLALEMTGDYVPRMKQTVDNTIKPGSYSADDLALAAKELEGWEGDRSNTRNRMDGVQGDTVIR